MKGSLGELRKDDGLNIEELSREFQNGKYLQLLEDLESVDDDVKFFTWEPSCVCMRVVAMLNMEDFLVIRDLYN